MAAASSCPWPRPAVPGASDAAHPRQPDRIPMIRSILVGILVFVAAGIGLITLQWDRTMNDGEPFGGCFTLDDQKGGEITEATSRNHPTTVFLGFTHCPEVCPTTLAELD